MGLEALSSNEFLDFIIYDTISASNPFSSQHGSLLGSCSNFLVESSLQVLPSHHQENSYSGSAVLRRQNSNLSGVHAPAKKKRRRKARVCKNREEAETQRMTHIAVERNRRKQMNEHLAVLRSLMPDSYVQRGDQASIVGGAIEFVKELEHLLQSLEAKKFQLLQGLNLEGGKHDHDHDHDHQSTTSSSPTSSSSSLSSSSANYNKLIMPNNNNKVLNTCYNAPPFAQFFVYPQYTWCQSPNKLYTGKAKASIADIEVTLIETHANLRIMTRSRSPRQLSRLVAGFQSLHLTILHVNVTTMDPLVLYSFSVKLEEGCQLTSVDDIAGAVHHMIGIIEEEDALVLLSH